MKGITLAALRMFDEVTASFERDTPLWCRVQLRMSKSEWAADGVMLGPLGEAAVNLDL
jgi:hypothetical protein